jgi:hypothetical protein
MAIQRDKSLKIIGVDFDGTVVTHAYPLVGVEIGAAPILKRLADKGHKIMLWTMRGSGQVLADAVHWFEQNKIPLWGINENPGQKKSGWSKSNKQHADIFIDDAAIGSFLKYDLKISERPFIDWNKVEIELVRLGLI